MSRLSSDLNEAVKRLKEGQLVAIPTETVYGLAGSIYNAKSINEIFRIKNRPFFDPLIVHVSSIDQAKSLVKSWPEAADCLAKHFWPGPLTLVLEKKDEIDSKITSGFPNIGIRMPNHPMTLEIIKQLDQPVAAPSANQFGRLSPTAAQDVLKEFPNDDFLVIDGGPCQIGIESTVLLILQDDAQILRPGMIQLQDIKRVFEKEGLDRKIELSTQASELSPGHLKNHYQPSIPFALVEEEVFQSQIESSLRETFKLSENSSLTELQLSSEATTAAREVYAKMRQISESGVEAFFFVCRSIHDQESWIPIMNRLLKASSARISHSSSSKTNKSL